MCFEKYYIQQAEMIKRPIFKYEPVDWRDQTLPVRQGTDDKVTAYARFIHEFDILSTKLAGLTPTIPMSLRHLCVAQMRHQAAENGGSTDESVRVKSFYAATLGFAFTLVNRIIRVVLRTVLAPISLAVAAHEQAKYGPQMRDGAGKHHIVAEDLRRIGMEWVDLGTTLLTPFIGLINMFVPKAISLHSLRNYYIERMYDVALKDIAWEEARKAYVDSKDAIQKVVEAAEKAVAEWRPSQPSHV